MDEIKNNLTKNQKFALVGLTVFGILLVGFWVINLNNKIRTPFLIKVADNNQIASSAQTDEEKLKTQDTDGDGLSDWNELNVYHTSPYLPDSDSDSLNDGLEVKNGTDPNCPQGKDCTAAAAIIPASSVVATSTAVDLTAGASAASVASTTQAEELSKILSCQDMKLLRKYLLDSEKIDQASLDLISDADLLKMCQDQAKSSTNTQ
jgi:hypothetical protein